MTWDHKTISELCQIRPPKSEAKNTLADDELVSVVPMECLDADGINLLPHASKELGEVYSKYVFFKDEDVLLAKITPCFENGKLGIARGLTNGIGFGSSEFIPFRCSSLLLPEFLYHFMSRKSFRDEGAQLMTGAVGHKRIPKDFYEGFRIPLPSLREQKRIVEVLDEAFATLDKVKANIERNIENARQLFQSQLDKLFQQSSNYSETHELGEIAAIRYGYTDKSNPQYTGPKFLRITDIQDGNVDWDLVPHCNPVTDKELEKFALHEGDIVFARTGATTGKSFMMPKVENAIFASYLIRVRLREADFAPFLLLYFSTSEYWRHISAGTTGSAQGGFNAKKLASLLIPIPPKNRQSEIIDELSTLKKTTDGLIEQHLLQLEELDHFRQSILEQAFEGKLTGEVTQIAEA